MGQQKSAITVAFEMSAVYMSPSMNVAFTGHARLLRQPIGQRHHLGIELDADGGGAAAGCGDDVAAIAESQVHDDVLWGDLRHVEHLLDERAGDVGTQTTSLPACPTTGTNGFSWAAADAVMVRPSATTMARGPRRLTVIQTPPSDDAWVRSGASRVPSSSRLLSANAVCPAVGCAPPDSNGRRACRALPTMD